MTQRRLQKEARRIIDIFGLKRVEPSREESNWTVAEDLLLLAYPVQASQLGRSLDQMDRRRNHLVDTLTLAKLQQINPKHELNRSSFDLRKTVQSNLPANNLQPKKKKDSEPASLVQKLYNLLTERYEYQQQRFLLSSIYQDVMLLMHFYFHKDDEIIRKVMTHFPDRIGRLGTLSVQYLKKLFQSFVSDIKLDPNEMAMFGKDDRTFRLYWLTRAQTYLGPSTIKTNSPVIKKEDSNKSNVTFAPKPHRIDTSKYSKEQLQQIICQRGEKLMVFSSEVNKVMAGLQSFHPDQQSCQQYSLLYNCDAERLYKDESYRKEFYIKNWKFLPNL